MPTWCLTVTCSALPLTHYSAIYNSSTWPWRHSSNPGGYINRPVGPRLFSIASAPASTTSHPQVFTSPLPAAPGCSIPRREDFVPEVPVVLAKRRQAITCKPACSVPDTPSVPTKRPQVTALQDHPVPVIVATSSHPCCAASCSCDPELPSCTTVPNQDWMPLWHSFGSSLWRKSLLLQACSCHLVPLHYK